ncbi:MAG: hypothetical protein ACK47B_12110 [Armatimonadota bacterium]
MRPPLHCLWLTRRAALHLAGVSCLAGTSASIRVSAESSGPLESDPRLKAEVTVTAREEPLAGFLARIARLTGAPVAAGSEVADERITLFARSRPAHEILAVVADHLDYQWVQRTRAGKPELVLIQSLAARRRELALRGCPEGEVAALRELLEEWRRLAGSPEVAALARRGPEEWRRRLGEIDERLHGRIVVEREEDGTSIRRVPLGPPPSRAERGALLREQRRLLILDPERFRGFNGLDAAGRLYSTLPAEGQAALWQGESIRFSFPRERDRVPISAQMAASIVAGGLGSLAHRIDEETGRDVPIPFHSAQRVRAELSLEDVGPDARLRVRVRTLGSYGDDRSHTRVETTFQEEVHPGSFHYSISEPQLDEQVRKLQLPISLPKPEKVKPEHPNLLADVLERLSAHLPYPIVADGYGSDAIHSPMVTVQEPAARVLERVCRSFSRHCRLERGYLSFRHVAWAASRAVEPPARRVEAWERRIRQSQALALPDLLEIGGSLTPGQADVLVQRWESRGFGGLSSLLEADLEQSRPMLRLLHSLPPPLLRTLSTGRPVPITALSAVSRRYALRVCADTVALFDGTEARPGAGERAFVLGRGFEEEDRLEAALMSGTLHLRRVPAAWLYAGNEWFHAENTEEALESARVHNPKATERDLTRVKGQRVEVVLQIPGAEPIAHFFLVASEEPPE